MGIEVEETKNDKPEAVIYSAVLREVRLLGFAEQIAFAGDLRTGRNFSSLPAVRQETWRRVWERVNGN